MAKTIGRFEIRRELGRGAQSVVYLAWDPQLEREVAIKTMHFSTSDAKRNKALLDEARAVSRLKHPNIVPIFDMGEQDGDPYLVFEYVAGPTLTEVIRRDGKIATARAADWMRQILDALAQAHAAGIIHRDLKPGNIMIETSGKPRVMDFGIASRVDANMTGGTVTGLTGTPIYMSPEYIDKQQVSPKLDVYAAGLVLFEMVTGKPAVTAESMVQIAFQVMTQPVAVPASAGVDDKLSGIILKACVKDPALRLADASQMKALLDDYLGAAATPIGSGDEEAKKQSTLDFLLRRMRHKADFPAFSDSVAAINKLTNSDKEGINKLSTAILKDYGLTNKILRMVNSATYRTSGGGSINTVSRAVMVLGFDTVRTIAITVLLFDHLQDKGNARELKEAFLRASLAGAIARDASKQLNLRGTEECYICALFHSLGQLLAQFYFSEEVLEMRKLMLQKGCSEEQAAIQVLGISFSELGIGIARHWGFSGGLLASLQVLPEGPVRKANTSEESLRVLAGFANELRDAIASNPKENRQKILGAVSTRFATAMPFSDKQLQSVLEHAFEEVTELAKVMHVNLKQSPFANQVSGWVGSHAQGGQGVASDGMSATLLGEPDLLGDEETHKDSGGIPDDAQSVLAAGIQDLSNTLVGEFALNDVLRIVLETMYRSIGFQRVMLCLKDPRAGTMNARFGLGPETSDLIKKFRFSLSYSADVFHLATSKGVDIIINDIDEPKIADKIPAWYRQNLVAKTFVLFPLNIKGGPVALIYCDRDKAGSIVLPEKELSLLKTLRNQALLAIKQSM